ncbi:MEAB protein [Metarhizium album ARSEF 1941]|uniref:MEAB protein n=1 Tax=Metarhizium album (strain ARSEF 1941) TaxID=1081103 RepID=A0A0B2X1R4_METAS|nr:MEAB protein [Metarhizium album ARSEF 1941]KHN99627.1 MEAB protein [Metarhizium album ARSEF 1941]
MSIDNKPNPPRDESADDSVDSTPEREQNAPAAVSGSSNNAVQDAQQPKRKGGRKPIYATSEERKQRNRQAQAAFRERRTEYIKQLEETIHVHESNLQNLQSAHRNAADECLMLRYKNSLLERILLEKGIDVQAELQAKADSPNLGPAHVPQNIVQPPPIQRPIMNRQHHSRKSASCIAPKLEPGSGAVGTAAMQARKPHNSPKSRPAPSSHSNSPNNGSSAFSPAPSDSISLRGSISGLTRQHLSLAGTTQPSRSTVLQVSTPRSVSGTSGSFYATPTFRSDHDYDNREDIVEDPEVETPGGHGAFASAFNSDTTQPMLLSPTSTGPAHHEQGGHQASLSNHHFPPMTQLLDHQNMDWDPFGLSASMAFPSQQFPFDQAGLR